MFNMNIYSIRDDKAEMFSNPMYQRNNAVAIRTFEQACQDPESQFRANPEDYSLWHVGEWHAETGIITPLESPTRLISALELLSQMAPDQGTLQSVGN